MEELPDEILQHIAEFLPRDEITRVSWINKRFRYNFFRAAMKLPPLLDYTAPGGFMNFQHQERYGLYEDGFIDLSDGHIVTKGDEGTIRVWSGETGDLLRQFKDCYEEVERKNLSLKQIVALPNGHFLSYSYLCYSFLVCYKICMG